MADQRRAGLIQVQVNGEISDAKGSFTYNLGRPMREAIVGSDGIHGYKETPQVAFIEGAITDRGTLDLATLVGGRDLTVSLTLGNGKLVVLRDAWFAGEGSGSTEEAEITVRWEGANAEEVS
ncbi:MAG TPA: phage tail tube protein [Candidatus Binatia bacterium]|nr:phage tail tube protein [Candidatus Binatia bacterium]